MEYYHTDKKGRYAEEEEDDEEDVITPPVSGGGGSDVTVTYPMGGTTVVYSIDIVFGSLIFTYTGAIEGTWNPETHVYDGAAPATWSCEQDANLITVTNHSNAAVEVEITYVPAPEYAGIVGTIENAFATLPSAVGKEVQNPALVLNAYLTLSGELDGDTEYSAVVGSITVTVAAVQEQ